MKRSLSNNSRQGVTLLFTISMIVLFLMMGTAFVIVANHYFRTATRRGQKDLRRKDPVELLDQAFYSVVRGPSLKDPASPLRGQSILEDLYGYGIKGRLQAESTLLPSSNGALLVLNVDPASFISVRSERLVPNVILDESYVDGLFNGRVVSLTSGQAAGYSTRIISHAAVDLDNDGEVDRLQIVIPRDERGINWNRVSAPDEILVNGREYSGYGAGQIADHQFDPDAEAVSRLVSDTDSSGNVDTDIATASRPNRIGEPFEKLVADEGYLAEDRGPNEPHDAPDQHNMFLAGPIDDQGNGIPSFHRDRLFEYQFQRSRLSEPLTPSQIRRFSFRPVHVRDAADSTAQVPGKIGLTPDPQSWFGRYNIDGSRDLSVAINAQDSLEVDNDMDGLNDSVWIDIGFPDQTDDGGFRYRPLVAYRIVDLDGRLNVNAHGIKGDISSPPAPRFGTGYGVAEISLAGLFNGNDYQRLLDNRYGIDRQPGDANNALTPQHFPTQKLIGHPRINSKTSFRFATAADFFASNSLAQPSGDPENMPEHVEYVMVQNHSPYISDFDLVGGVGDAHFRPSELEGLIRRSDIDAPLVGDRLANLPPDVASALTTHSFEIAIPAVPNSIAELLRERLAQHLDGEQLKQVYNIFTGDRFLNRDTGRVIEMKYISKEMLMGGRFDLNRLIGNGIDDDLNGVADNPEELALGIEGAVIEAVSIPQHGTPVFDLNNDPFVSDASIRTLMARQLYILTLLTCGEFAPEGYPMGTPKENETPRSADELYRQSVAQWAVNVVDFYDTDSTITVFEFDLYPFDDPRDPANLVDGDPTTDDSQQRAVVYGIERPEILITETFAHHDRQSQGAAELEEPGLANRTLFAPLRSSQPAASQELDFVSARVPQTSFYVELYHPHRQSITANSPDTGFQTLPHELSDNRPPTNFRASTRSTVRGVDMDLLAPDGTPVWRIAVHRGPAASEADEHIRTVYLTDPILSKAPDPGHDCFFPAVEVPTVMPNDPKRCYLVMGTDGNVGRGEQTFGRLTRTDADEEPTLADIRSTRAINLSPGKVEVRDFNGRGIETIDRACITSTINQFRIGHGGMMQTRGLSLSDPDGGYQPNPSNIDRTKQRDGITLKTPRDRHFDDEMASGNRDKDDMQAIWTNGIQQENDYQFRVLKLQRLADPRSDFHEVANPYVTIDVANVDLLAFNGMHANPRNDVEPEFDDSIGTMYALADGGTTLGGIERGEQLADKEAPDAARRKFYRALGRIEATDKSYVKPSQSGSGDGHNFSYKFTDGDVSRPNAAERHETLGGRNASFDDTNQYSWLAWNNRPFANALELANVPMLSAEGMVRHFNRDEAETDSLEETATADDAFSFFFGDDQFGHLMAFGPVRRNNKLTPNRFDWLWEYIEVPNRFLGSEKFLATRNQDEEPIFVPADGPLKFSLHPPHHTIPNFRYPGKVNLNTIYRQEIWDALVRGYGNLNFETFRENRDSTQGATDFGGYYTTPQGAEFTDNPETLRKGGNAWLFRIDDRDDQRKLTDSVDSDNYGDGTDAAASAAFRNELRTRLGIAATTRSNVYALWLTIGYFEVDDFGRLGAEVGSQQEGQVERHRAFYIVDRSIPVAAEPGKNHNVDQAVLIRTIIE